MNIEFIIQLLKEKQRGIYPLIVDEYFDAIHRMKVKVAKVYIEKDLFRRTGNEVSLTYRNLYNAIKNHTARNLSGKIKKVISVKESTAVRPEFPDAYETEDLAQKPGSFTIKPKPSK